VRARAGHIRREWAAIVTIEMRAQNFAVVPEMLVLAAVP
jgi:hypothetical protein